MIASNPNPTSQLAQLLTFSNNTNAPALAAADTTALAEVLTAISKSMLLAPANWTDAQFTQVFAVVDYTMSAPGSSSTSTKLTALAQEAMVARVASASEGQVVTYQTARFQVQVHCPNWL